MFGWFRRRQTAEDSIWDPPASQLALGNVSRPTLPTPPRPITWFDLEPEHVNALTNQVMWARDTIMWLLHQTAAHRWDGHDCPVYCIPPTMDMFLSQCTAADLRLLVATFTKDSVHIGHLEGFEDFEDVDDEPESGSPIM